MSGSGTVDPVFFQPRRCHMAKRKASTPTVPKATEETEPPEARVLTPQQVHELLGLPGPYEPPRAPPPWPGYLTFWDPGISIAELRRKQPSLFYPVDWLD